MAVACGLMACVQAGGHGQTLTERWPPRPRGRCTGVAVRLTRGEGCSHLGGLGDIVAVEAHHNSANVLLANLDIKEDLGANCVRVKGVASLYIVRTMSC